MMPAIRRLATRVIEVVVRHSPPDAQSWGSAMLREMDFVEDDWSAALWALGSTTTLCRYSLVQKLDALIHPMDGAWSLYRVAKKIPAMLAGMIAAAAVLVICLLLLSSLLRASWLNPALARLFDRLLFVVIPEALYLAGAIALWRQRKAAMAIGIVAAGAILMAHAVVHFVTHG
jgi:putative effector of murein hydrolase LrgA (UPF0299 family)